MQNNHFSPRKAASRHRNRHIHDLTLYGDVAHAVQEPAIQAQRRLTVNNQETMCYLLHSFVQIIEKICHPDHSLGQYSNVRWYLFDHLPKYVSSSSKRKLLYYLLVDQKGAAKLSCFTIKSGKFSQFRERIFLSDGDDLFSVDEGAEDSLPDFELTVKRK